MQLFPAVKARDQCQDIYLSRFLGVIRKVEISHNNYDGFGILIKAVRVVDITSGHAYNFTPREVWCQDPLEGQGDVAELPEVEFNVSSFEQVFPPAPPKALVVLRMRSHNDCSDHLKDQIRGLRTWCRDGHLKLLHIGLNSTGSAVDFYVTGFSLEMVETRARLRGASQALFQSVVRYSRRQAYFRMRLAGARLQGLMLRHVVRRAICEIRTSLFLLSDHFRAALIRLKYQRTPEIHAARRLDAACRRTIDRVQFELQVGLFFMSMQPAVQMAMQRDRYRLVKELQWKLKRGWMRRAMVRLLVQLPHRNRGARIVQRIIRQRLDSLRYSHLQNLVKNLRASVRRIGPRRHFCLMHGAVARLVAILKRSTNFVALQKWHTALPLASRWAANEIQRRRSGAVDDHSALGNLRVPNGGGNYNKRSAGGYSQQIAHITKDMSSQWARPGSGVVVQVNELTKGRLVVTVRAGTRHRLENKLKSVRNRILNAGLRSSTTQIRDISGLSLDEGPTWEALIEVGWGATIPTAFVESNMSLMTRLGLPTGAQPAAAHPGFQSSSPLRVMPNFSMHALGPDAESTNIPNYSPPHLRGVVVRAPPTVPPLLEEKVYGKKKEPAARRQPAWRLDNNRDQTGAQRRRVLQRRLEELSGNRSHSVIG